MYAKKYHVSRRLSGQAITSGMACVSKAAGAVGLQGFAERLGLPATRKNSQAPGRSLNVMDHLCDVLATCEAFHLRVTHSD